MYYSIFIIPLFTGFLFGGYVLDGSIASKRTIKLGQNVGDDTSEQTNLANGQNKPLSQKEYHKLKEEIVKEKEINITDEKYVPIVNIIQEDVDKIIGKTVKITGFVYRDSKLYQDEIIVARYGIACCVADASIYGLMVKGKVKNLPTNKWVVIYGIVEKTKHQGEVIPQLKTKNVSIISPPKNPYVYDAGVFLN